MAITIQGMSGSYCFPDSRLQDHDSFAARHCQPCKTLFYFFTLAVVRKNLFRSLAALNLQAHTVGRHACAVVLLHLFTHSLVGVEKAQSVASLCIVRPMLRIVKQSTSGTIVLMALNWLTSPSLFSFSFLRGPAISATLFALSSQSNAHN
jgi:hypothetical protein